MTCQCDRDCAHCHCFVQDREKSMYVIYANLRDAWLDNHPGATADDYLAQLRRISQIIMRKNHVTA